MARQLIAIDIDDTLADSTELIRLNVNLHYNLSIPKEAYKSKGEYWGYYERVWKEHGLASLTINDLDEVMVDEIANVPLLPSALFAVKELYNRYDVVIITARGREREVLTRQWIDKMFQGLAIDVHFSEAHKDESKMTKGQICRLIGASYLIDDNIGHCESALAEGVSPILFGDYGWHDSSDDKIIKCKDWPSVLEYFEGIHGF